MMEHLRRYRISISIVFFLLYFYWGFREYSIVEPLATPDYWLPIVIVFSLWLFLLVDMIRTKIYHKTFWIASMFLLPWLAPVFYLFQRKKLEHLRENRFQNS